MTSDQGVEELFNSIPVNRFMGYRLLACEDGAAELSMTPREDFRQEGGVVQGGVISALADTATAYSFVLSLGEQESMTGLEYKINFVRPASIEGADLVASARVIRRGGRVGVSEVKVTQGDLEVAVGLFTYLFVARQGAD